MGALITAVIGGIVGALVTWLLTPNPTKEINSIKTDVSGLKQHFNDLKREVAQEREDDARWIGKLDRVVAELRKIGSSTFFTLPGTSTQTGLYTSIFQNEGMRQQIEEHLVERSRGTLFVAREVSNEKLRREAIRRLIDDAQERIDAFRKSRPDIARDYMLPPDVV